MKATEPRMSFQRFAGRIGNSLHAKINGDAVEEKLLAMLDRLEHVDVSDKDRHTAQRVGVELDYLSKRCRMRARRLGREIAKWPEPVLRAYRDELEKGGR